MIEVKKGKDKYRFIGLGPHQRRILQLLEKNPNMTLRELAKIIYGFDVTTSDDEYNALSRSLRGLQKKGLVNRETPEARWNLK